MPAKLKPWERREKEGSDVYADFIAYRNLGPKRSIEALVQSCTETSPKTVRQYKNLSAKYGWVERCRAWDDYLQAERDKEAAKHAAEIERRRLAEIQDVFDMGSQLRATVRQMLKFPLATMTTSKDGKTTVVEPARWTLRDAFAGAKVSVEMIAAALAAWGKDTVDMTDGELEAVANIRIEDF